MLLWLSAERLSTLEEWLMYSLDSAEILSKLPVVPAELIESRQLMLMRHLQVPAAIDPTHQGPTMAAHAAITVAKPPMIATITSVFTPTLGFAGRTATTAFGNRLRV